MTTPVNITHCGICNKGFGSHFDKVVHQCISSNDGNTGKENNIYLGKSQNTNVESIQKSTSNYVTDSVQFVIDILKNDTLKSRPKQMSMKKSYKFVRKKKDVGGKPNLILRNLRMEKNVTSNSPRIAKLEAIEESFWKFSNKSNKSNKRRPFRPNSYENIEETVKKYEESVKHLRKIYDGHKHDMLGYKTFHDDCREIISKAEKDFGPSTIDPLSISIAKEGRYHKGGWFDFDKEKWKRYSATDYDVIGTKSDPLHSPVKQIFHQSKRIYHDNLTLQEKSNKTEDSDVAIFGDVLTFDKTIDVDKKKQPYEAIDICRTNEPFFNSSNYPAEIFDSLFKKRRLMSSKFKVKKDRLAKQLKNYSSHINPLSIEYVGTQSKVRSNFVSTDTICSDLIDLTDSIDLTVSLENSDNMTNTNCEAPSMSSINKYIEASDDILSLFDNSKSNKPKRVSSYKSRRRKDKQAIDDKTNFGSKQVDVVDVSSSTSRGVSRKCSFCERCFEYNDDQLNEIKSHTLEHFEISISSLLPKTEPFICPKCNKLYQDNVSLLHHFSFRHNMIYDFCSKDDLFGKLVEEEESISNMNLDAESYFAEKFWEYT